MIIRNHTVNFTAYLVDAQGLHRRVPLTFCFFGEHFSVLVDGQTQLENCVIPEIEDFDALRIAEQPCSPNLGVHEHNLGGFKRPVVLRVSSRKEFSRRSFQIELVWFDLRVGKCSLTVEEDGTFSQVYSGTDCLTFVSQQRALRAE